MAVYLIRCGSSGPVKIGSATDPERRRRLLQNGSPEELFLLRVVDGDRDLECALHKKFAAIRTRGEWFKATPEILAEDWADVFVPSRPDGSPHRSQGLMSPDDIERAARARGMTLKDVCEQAGIAMSIFTRWRSGRTSPRLTSYEKLVSVVFGAT